MPTNLHTAYTHTESTQIKYTWTLNTHILHNSQNTHDSHTEYIFVIHTIQTYTYTHHTHAQTWYKPTIQYICDAHTSIIHVIQNRQYPNSSHIHNTRCMHAYKTHTDIIQKIHTHIIDTPHVYKMHTLYSCRQTIQNPHKHIKHFIIHTCMHYLQITHIRHTFVWSRFSRCVWTCFEKQNKKTVLSKDSRCTCTVFYCIIQAMVHNSLNWCM